MPTNNLPESIKELREAMGNISQVTLAVKMARSLTMVQRFERGENVGAKDLAVLAGFAVEAKRPDLKWAFKTALLEMLGPDVVALIREEEDEPAAKEAASKSKGHKGRLSA